MSIWGKIAGAAAGFFTLGGPIGALLGAVAGHMLLDREGRRRRDSEVREERPDRSFRDRDEVAFTIGVIALAAKLAKADGTVTRDEVEVFKRVFPVPREEEANVGHLFNLAKQDVAGFDSYAKQLASLFRAKPGVLEDLLDSLFLIAKADAQLHPGELEYLRHVSEIFGFTEDQFQRVRASHFGRDHHDPYAVLGVEPAASDEDLKRAYHRLVKDNHPDSLIARGVPEEFVRLATEKLAAINGAYEAIKKQRGIN
ncbi:MAG: TerB family tellurite resistance protein [Alphaproteobacteria bacterium]|nr:TerB family tellurite resistance protein [Alphaproteobacteria bacterium]